MSLRRAFYRSRNIPAIRVGLRTGLDTVVAYARRFGLGRPTPLQQVLDGVRALEKEVAALRSKLASNQGDALLSQAVEVAGAKVLAAMLEGADVPALREAVDRIFITIVETVHEDQHAQDDEDPDEQ